MNEYLQQNLLLPPNTNREFRPTVDVGRLDTQGRQVTVSVIQEENTSTFATYENIYIKNPVRPPIDSLEDLADPDRFDKGAISGVAIKDLERQGEGGVLNTLNTTQPNEIFTHSGHDLTRMTNDMNSRGFTQNIAGTVRGAAAGALKPAVENIKDWHTFEDNNYRNNAGDKQAVHKELGDTQYFPFLFTTDNKVAGADDGPWQQACYLQATIDNLSESFAPTWQPKHFFGRTEQIQTYTNTQRSIDVSFLVFAGDMRALQNLWERVSWLAQQTYGQYDSDGSRSRLLNGPILRMTIGDLYVGLPGYISSLTYDWNALGAGGKWEMTQGLRMPMACKIQMSYSIMHDDNPDRNYNLYPGLTEGIMNGGPLSPAGGERERLIPSNPSTEPIDRSYADLLDINSSVGNERQQIPSPSSPVVEPAALDPPDDGGGDGDPVPTPPPRVGTTFGGN